MNCNRRSLGYTKRNLHQLLKGKQQHITLYGVYIEELHDLMAVIRVQPELKQPRPQSLYFREEDNKSGNI
jgi:hypothetical protein